MTTPQRTVAEVISWPNPGPDQIARPNLEQAALTLAETLSSLTLDSSPNPESMQVECTPNVLQEVAHELCTARDRLWLQQTKYCFLRERYLNLPSNFRGLDGVVNELTSWAATAFEPPDGELSVEELYFWQIEEQLAAGEKAVCNMLTQWA